MNNKTAFLSLLFCCSNFFCLIVRFHYYRETIVKEKDNTINFLDVEVKKGNNGLETKFYHKQTNTTDTYISIHTIIENSDKNFSMFETCSYDSM